MAMFAVVLADVAVSCAAFAVPCARCPTRWEVSPIFNACLTSFSTVSTRLGKAAVVSAILLGEGVSKRHQPGYANVCLWEIHAFKTDGVHTIASYTVICCENFQRVLGKPCSDIFDN